LQREEAIAFSTGPGQAITYQIGKLQIMKLREDYKAMKGDKFSLQEFHDEFMRQGGMPVKIIRKAMLGNDTATLQ